jgi:hypothetical protein
MTISRNLSILAEGVSSSGVLAVTNGGTGVTTSTGTGNNVLSASPTLTGTLTVPTVTSAAATALTIQSAGTTAVTIDTSQNVGIGTSSPIGASGYGWLTINGSSNGSAASFETAGTENFRIQINNGTSAVYLNTISAWPMLFQTNNTEAMRIDSSGNVGIGTSLPSSYGKLTVNGNIVLGAPATRNAASTAYVGIWTTGDPSDDNRANIGFSTVAGAASSSSYITFATNNYGVSGGERMRIDSSGNVGIGVVPAGNEKLRVEGTDARIRSRNSTSGADLYMGAMTPNEARLWAFTSTDLTIGTNNTERMRIDSSGNVGIGTSSPNASAILDAQSTTKGVRFPNMTTTQKNAISSPAAGLVVFDTTLAKLCVYSGSAWQTITSV